MPETSSVKALMTRVKKEKEQLKKAQEKLLGDPTEKEMKRQVSRYSRGPRLTKEAYEEKKKMTAATRKERQNHKEARTVVENMMSELMGKLALEINKVEIAKEKAAVPSGGYKRPTISRRRGRPASK